MLGHIISELDEQRAHEEMKKEETYHRTHTAHYQKNYFLSRAAVRPALQSIVHNLFETYVAQESVGVEFGCGAQGTFYHLLLPPRFKSSWTQFDINPSFVQSNKRFSRYNMLDYKALIKEGNLYDMPLEDSSVDLVLGLSSWDCITRFEESLAQVQRVLKPGGYFIHIQDINPAEQPLLIVEHYQRKAQGIPTAVRMDTELVGQAHIWEKIGLRIQSSRHDNEMIRLSTYLNQHLGLVSAQSGLNVVMCTEVQQEVESSRWDYWTQALRKYPGLFMQISQKVNSISASTNRRLAFGTNEGQRGIRTKVSVDVLVARKS